MHIVSIHNLKVYGYHGCLPEEEVIGTNYHIDVDVYTDFSEAAETDNLSKTIDYVVIASIVKEEMAVRAKLIENVCHRIISRIKKKYPSAQKARVTLHKISPPAGVFLESVSVTIEE